MAVECLHILLSLLSTFFPQVLHGPSPHILYSNLCPNGSSSKKFSMAVLLKIECTPTPRVHSVALPSLNTMPFLTLCNRFSVSLFIIQPPKKKYFACLVHGCILQNPHNNMWGIHSKCPINVCDMNGSVAYHLSLLHPLSSLFKWIAACALPALLGVPQQVLILHPPLPAQVPTLPKSAGTYPASSSTCPSPFPAQICPSLTTVFWKTHSTSRVCLNCNRDHGRSLSPCCGLQMCFSFRAKANLQHYSPSCCWAKVTSIQFVFESM